MIKKIIAREWLILLLIIVLGLSLDIIFNFIKTEDNNIKRKILYTQLIEDNFISDTYESFCIKLDDPDQRKQLYKTISEKYDVGGYETFEQKISHSRIRKTIYNVFHINTSSEMLIFILLPYISLQLIRTIVWSIKTIKN